MSMQMVGIPRLPLLSVAELLMSPVMKEDSCFLTVSFHIRRIRLYMQVKPNKGSKEDKGKRVGGEAVVMGVKVGRRRDKPEKTTKKDKIW